jgi:hypothetical protein
MIRSGALAIRPHTGSSKVASSKAQPTVSSDDR